MVIRRRKEKKVGLYSYPHKCNKMTNNDQENTTLPNIEQHNPPNTVGELKSSEIVNSSCSIGATRRVRYCL